MLSQGASVSEQAYRVISPGSEAHISENSVGSSRKLPVRHSAPVLWQLIAQVLNDSASMSLSVAVIG